jgi:serine protease AprX
MMFVLAAALLSMMVLWPKATNAALWEDKVDAWVLDTAVAQPQTEFLVYLTEQADLSGAAALPTKAEKGAYVYEQLTAVANRTQPPLIQSLETANATFQPYWIANMVWVRGDLALVESLAQRPDVAHIYANPTVRGAEPQPITLEEAKSLLAIEWNIDKINAPDVWAAGFTGQTIVIGGQDTGYDWDHPALINQYRGWNGSSADHNYNWHDAIHVGGSSCGADSPVPCDDNGHGTHTMGTMVGDDGGVNQIGVAPGAQWIGCRNMNAGDGTPATYTECYQWFIAPTNLNNQNPDPGKAPHVINNSWGCPASEGCTDPNVLLTVVENVRAAGIVTVHSAGNSGASGCSTVNTPSATYDASFTVGSTTSTDAISSFSSRGPVLVDGSGRLKPDISAPGSSIRSSVPGTSYGFSSGTSMAGPHVAGMVALLLSVNPDLAGQVDEIEAIITSTAVPLTSAQTCGGVSGAQIPNNTFGWGRIDAWAAYLSMSPELYIHKEASATAVAPGETLTYTLTVTQTNTAADATNLVLTDTLPVGVDFITATLPYTQVGTTIYWSWEGLAAKDRWTAQLVVAVPEDSEHSAVENVEYGVRADGVTAVAGPPITTPVISNPPPPRYDLYLPFVTSSEE